MSIENRAQLLRLLARIDQRIARGNRLASKANLSPAEFEAVIRSLESLHSSLEAVELKLNDPKRR